MAELKQKIATNLDTNFLKIVASIAMLLDHAGKSIFLDFRFLQIIGRIAFPIYAYCIVVGCVLTRDIKKYFLRIIVFFVIAQPIYAFFYSRDFQSFIYNLQFPNIFLDLAVGILFVWGVRDKIWQLPIIAIIITFFGNTDYGFYGLCLIASFYFFKENPALGALAIGTQLILPFFAQYETWIFGFNTGIQGFAVLSMPFIFIKTRFYPKVSRYAFYVFYPAHLLALKLFSILWI